MPARSRAGIMLRRTAAVLSLVTLGLLPSAVALACGRPRLALALFLSPVMPFFVDD